MKAYVLTNSTHHQYEIIAIFSTREKAEKDKATRANCRDNIDEYEFDPKPMKIERIEKETS